MINSFKFSIGNIVAVIPLYMIAARVQTDKKMHVTKEILFVFD